MNPASCAVRPWQNIRPEQGQVRPQARTLKCLSSRLLHRSGQAIVETRLTEWPALPEGRASLLVSIWENTGFVFITVFSGHHAMCLFVLQISLYCVCISIYRDQRIHFRS